MCWGDGREGTMGNGTVTVEIKVPVPVSGLAGTTSLAVGSKFACAVTSNGEVVCWGLNGGQLGVSSAQTPLSKAPVTVAGLTGRTARAVAAGSQHACALFADETVSCWGSNTDGQHGITSLDQVVAITAGSGHSCALSGCSTSRRLPHRHRDARPVGPVESVAIHPGPPLRGPGRHAPPVPQSTRHDARTTVPLSPSFGSPSTETPCPPTGTRPSAFASLTHRSPVCCVESSVVDRGFACVVRERLHPPCRAAGTPFPRFSTGCGIKL